MAARPSGRPPPGVYHFSIPVKPVLRDISVESLERIATYNGVYGALLIAAGVGLAVLPLLFAWSTELILGWGLVVVGAVTSIHAVFLYGAPGTISFFLLAAAHLVFGLWLVTEPATPSSAGFVTILAAWFLVQGLLKLGLAFSMAALACWSLVTVSGVVSVCLTVAAFSLSQAPRYLGALAGADLALIGVSLTVTSLLASWGVYMVTQSEEPLLQGALGGPGEGAGAARGSISAV